MCTWTPFRYQNPMGRLIQAFKFGHRLDVGRVLGSLMVQARSSSVALERPQLLIPVPLHAQRLRERGYNQALELARPLGRTLGIPVDAYSCVRTRATQVQSLLPQNQRAKNVKGAFALRKPLTVRHVAIIDDVMTTGATVTEMARVLTASGVGRVEVWACARAAPAAAP